MLASALRKLTGSLLPAAILAPMAIPAAPACAQDAADPFQSSVTMLRMATHAQRDGGHLPLLFALRQLRDPDLRNVFLQLLQQGASDGQWQMQVHAVLGLAEIDPNKQVDPWLITQVGPEAQEAVIATALDTSMLSESVIPEILKWDKLDSMARMLLLAERQLLGQPADVQELGKLSNADKSHVAGLASALIAQSGGAAAFNAFVEAVKTKPTTERINVTLWLIDAARRYQLTALCDWISALFNDPDVDSDVAYRATLALLSLDNARGLVVWQKYLGDAPSFSHRVRCGTMLLTAGDKVPAAAYDKLLPIGEDEALLARIIDLGKALSSSSDPGEAFIALLDLGHMKTSLWATERLRRLPPEQSRRVYEYLIDRMKTPRSEWTDGVAQSVEATSRLYMIDSQAVLDRLKAAEDDSPIQQSLLLGLFESGGPDAGAAAAALPRMGSGRADSLALLLQAKHAKSLTPDQLKQLGMIASGGGRVSEILQVQAGWLYLKHAGKKDQAIAAVFAKE